MKINFSSLCTALLLVMLTSGLAPLEAAKVYTWKDANGTTHYSDKPFPQAKNSKEVRIRAARPKNRTAADSSAAANSSASTYIDADDDKRVKAECAKARNNLVTLASGKTISRTNENGEKVTLDEASIQAEVQKNQSYINSFCRNQVASDNSYADANDTTNEEDDPDAF